MNTYLLLQEILVMIVLLAGSFGENLNTSIFGLGLSIIWLGLLYDDHHSKYNYTTLVRRKRL